jgi:hypothetical protein
MISESGYFEREMPVEFSEENIKIFLQKVFSGDSSLIKYRQNDDPDFEMKSKSAGFLNKMAYGEDYIIEVVSYDEDGVLTVNVFADDDEKKLGDKKKTVVKISGEALKEIK